VAEQAQLPARHLLLASSVPFLLAPGLHHAEALDEALADGAWGALGARAGEWLRRLGVMDHWASFRASHRAMAELVTAIARGEHGDAPTSIVMLSGDVHHGYVAEVGFRPGTDVKSRVWQAVSSGFRKELAPHERAVIRLGHVAVLGRLARRLARAAGVAPLPIGWRIVDNAAYANQVATLTLEGDRVAVRIEAVVDGTWEHPELHEELARELT
jgi:hypothetical protein